MRRLTPYALLAVLMLGTGLGIGLGLSEAPATSQTIGASVTCASPPRFELRSCALSPSIRTARQMLVTIVLPPEARAVPRFASAPFRLPGSSLGCYPLTDVVAFWTFRGSATSTVRSLEEAGPKWLPLSSQGELVSPGQPVAYTVTHQSRNEDRFLSIVVAETGADMVGVRADAIVVPHGARCFRAGT
jgi:hypothetical protein